MLEELLPLAEQIALVLRDRHQTIAIAESSTGGLLAAALLAIPGASAYFLGGAVVYTRQARWALLEIPESAMHELRASTEQYVLLLARTTRERFDSTWAVGESGATGPSGNRYGDPAGHCCIAVSGPREKTHTLETAHSDRRANMRLFAQSALRLLLETIA